MDKGSNKGGGQAKGKPSTSKGKGSTADAGARTAKGEGKQTPGDGAARTGKGKGGTNQVAATRQENPELPKELEAISRELVQLLRHKGLQELRPDGFAPLTAVVAALRTQPTRHQIEAVVLLSKKEGVARFELLEEDGEKWVRARDKVSLFGAARSQQQQQAVEMAYAGRSAQQQSLQQLQGHPTLSIPEAEDFGYALYDFDGSPYGSDYLSVRKGVDLIWRTDINVEAGWAYGKTNYSSGWFPANLWAPFQPPRGQVRHQASSSSQQRVAHQASSVQAYHAGSFQQAVQQAMPATVNELAAELMAARAQIAQLQVELAKERGISAQMRQALEALARGASSQGHPQGAADARASASSGPQEASADARASASQAYQQATADAGADHFPALEEGAAALRRRPNNGHMSDKQKLLHHLSVTFPNIESNGVQYDIIDRKTDAQGRTLWCARVEVKDLNDSFVGEFCPSQKDAEQSAAFHALLQLGVTVTA